MTIDRRLLERLESKLGISRSQIYRRIDERSRTLMLSPEQAAIALALEHRVSVHRIATPEDMAAIRGAAVARAPAVAPATQEVPRKIKAGTARKTRAKRSIKTKKGKGGKAVFVIHGRDVELRKSFFAFLRALGLQPIEFSKAVNTAVRAGGGGSPYVGDVVKRGLRNADAIVALLSPDDVARLKKQFLKPSDPPEESRLTGQARANVLFETGMALGVKPDVTILVQVGKIRPFSDVGGMHIVHLNDSVEARQELAGRLQATGLDVDTDGADWYGAGTLAAS